MAARKRRRGMMLPLAFVVQLASACAPEAAPGTLAAVAATESRFDPLAIGDNTTGTSWRPGTRQEAVALARSLIGDGHAVDLGLMQIDASNLAPLHLSLSQSFNPCASLSAGARVLAADYTPAPVAGSPTHQSTQAALQTALSRYNTGSPTKGFRNGYVTRVLAAAKRVVPEIDPGTTAAEPSKPAAAPAAPSWNVFDVPTDSAQPAGSGWDVFPRSVGPDRLQPSPGAATGGASSADRLVGE
jgi:type IV secretion system protein VirB1